MNLRPVRVLELRSVWGTGGGPEKTILLGAVHADRAQCDVTICYIRDQRDEVFGIDRRAEQEGVSYVEIREKHSFDASVVGRLRAVIAAGRFDIVHAHDYKTDVMTWWLARSGGFIPVATAHGWTGHSGKERRVYYPLDRWALSRYPLVFAVSTDIKQQLVGAGADGGRVEVLLNGIDATKFRRDPGQRPAARAAWGLAPGALVVGAVGRLEPQKNFPLLIEVFERVAASMPSLHLALAGDGSLAASLEQQRAASAMSPRIHLLGHVADIRRFHDAIDVFVQASDYEGTPNAVLEAMAMESPIVATDAGGTAEIARDGVDALIIPCRDGLAMERALRRALDDSAGARERVASARARVEVELSFVRRVRHLERRYAELAAERGRRR